MILPPDFQAMIRNPLTKAAFSSEIKAINPLQCENCGGAGYLYLFIATAGPFQSPPSPGKMTHWGKGQFKEGWWEGKTFSGECPVCKSSGKKQEELNVFHPSPEILRQMDLAAEKARMPYKDNNG